MSALFWPNCLQQLEQKLSDQQLNTWIRPLQIKEDENTLTLLAPNRFVLDWVKQNFKDQIQGILHEIGAVEVTLNIEMTGKEDVSGIDPKSEFSLSVGFIINKGVSNVFDSLLSETSGIDFNLNFGVLLLFVAIPVIRRRK